MLALVITTIFYALRTHDISEATKKQALANEAMAKEVREQSIRQVRPVIKIDHSGFDSDDEGMNEREALREFDDRDVMWCRLTNIGTGPALNVSADLEWPLGWDLPRGSQVLISLGPGAASSPFGLAVNEDQILVTYSDMSGRKYVSRCQVIYENTTAGPEVGRLVVEDLSEPP